MSPLRIAVSIAVLVCCAGVRAASAQSADRRVEVGVHAAVLRLSDFDSTSSGIGGRLSFNFRPWFGIEGEGSFFPHDDVAIVEPLPQGPRVSYHRRRAEAFFGPTIGHRGDRVGIFAKARPGFARLTDKGVDCPSQICALMLLAVPDYRTEFAFDYGGVVEFYPTDRIVTRFDVGDVMIRHRGLAAPPCASFTTHNLRSQIGLGFRF
jgi:hypothetical protein